MFLISSFFILLSFFKIHNLINFLAKHLGALHIQCISISPPSPYRDFYSALVCGADLPPGALTESFKVSGLLHIMVVSGSHLIFLLFFYEKLFKGRFNFLKVPLLFFYTIVTGFQAPTIRALIGIGIRKINQTRKYFWDEVQITWITGMLTILLIKNWTTSYSLLLSWAATLALSLTQETKGLKRHAVIFVILFPVLIPLNPPNPISIVMNFIFAPILELILFPLSVLSFAIPISKYVDYLWVCIEFILNEVRLSFTPAQSYPISISILWLYLFFLNLYFYFRRILKYAR